MECPSCGGQSLSGGNDGQLVCDDCNEQFHGFREEEMDVAFVGTATSRRQSQASQAELTRIRRELESKENEAKSMVGDDRPNEPIIFCEAVIQIATDVLHALQRDNLLPDSTIAFLKPILKHWVLRQHACSSLGFLTGSGHRGFRCPYILSLIALTLMYVRSPILPRDLAIFAAHGRIPYLRALRDSGIQLQDAPRVRRALTPVSLPTVEDIKAGMVLYGTDEFMWPPLKTFFDGPAVIYSQYTTVYAPLGHIELTLFRLTRYLGLPDDFGARVLRYMDLRKKARRWLDSIDPPHRYTKSFHTSLPPPEANAPCWNVQSMHDCCEHPTDRTLQIDILNVIRLNYGKSNDELTPEYQFCDSDEDKDARTDVKLREEWQACLRRIREWVVSGGGKDDATFATWSLLSQPALSNLRGKDLDGFCEFTKTVNPDGKVPVFLRPFAAEYKGMADRKQASPQKPSAKQRLSLKKEEWNWSMRHVDAKREFAGLEVRDNFLVGDGKLKIDALCESERHYLLPVMFGRRTNDGRGVTYEWEEPLEFGIVWSMMNRFFDPCALGDTIQQTSAIDDEADDMIRSVDHSLAMVMNYLNLRHRASVFRVEKDSESK